MARKLVTFDGASLQALEILARDEGKTVQDLIDQAIADLLKKHRRPTTPREMFKQSLKAKGRRAKA